MAARYYVQIQERADYNGRFGVGDWRSYRKFSAWPKTFPTHAEAQAFMDACFTFKNLHGRKLSASVEQCGYIKNRLTRGTRY